MNNSLAVKRNEMNLTQKGLSEKVGISRIYLSEIERGKRSPSVNIAIRIAKELDTTVEKIFF